MSRYYNQCRSSFRTGEPADHIAGKELVAGFAYAFGYDDYLEYPLTDYGTWYYQHDVGLFKRGLSLHIKDSRDNSTLYNYPIKLILDQYSDPRQLITFPYKKELDQLLGVIAEVDDRDLHMKKAKRRKDGVAQGMAAQLACYARFVRLDKDEINGEPLHALEYLQKNLKPYLY